MTAEALSRGRRDGSGGQIRNLMDDGVYLPVAQEAEQHAETSCRRSSPTRMREGLNAKAAGCRRVEGHRKRVVRRDGVTILG